TEENPGSAYRARDVQASLRQGGGRTGDPHGTEVDSDPLGTSQGQDRAAPETPPAHALNAVGRTGFGNWIDRDGKLILLEKSVRTDLVAGTLLFVSTDWWAPVLAGIVGNMTVGAGEVGPFLSLEQAILPQTAGADRRTLAFSLYNLVGYGASSAGALLAGLPRY